MVHGNNFYPVDFSKGGGEKEGIFSYGSVRHLSVYLGGFSVCGEKMEIYGYPTAW